MTKKKNKNVENLTLKIDKAIVEALGIDKDTEVEMYVKDKVLIVKPKNLKLNEKREDHERTKKLMDEYDPVLKKLAKT